MSGCEGCFTSQRGMQRAFDTIYAQAKAYAMQHNTTVVIYQEGYEFAYIRQDQATGLNIISYVTQYQ